MSQINLFLKVNKMKKIMQYHIANEAIDFQNGDFFKDLTACIDEIRSMYKGTTLPKFNSEVFSPLSKSIKKHTNLKIIFEEGGPAIYSPRLTINHTFFSNSDRELMQEYSEWDSYGDVRPLLKAMEKDVVKGTVSLNTSKVSGVFEKMELNMLLPAEMFNMNSEYTSGEVAAIMLHETGHAFTAMEFLSRTITTNQVLAGMTRALDENVPEKSREVIFAKGMDLLKMTSEQRQALLNTKDKRNVTCVVLDSAINNSVSELGKSIYDINSCEQLADQFATRHGAGRELVTGLDKLIKSGNYTSILPLLLMFAYMVALTNLVVGTITFGIGSFIIIVLIVLTNSKEVEVYDNAKSRFIRIKLQNIERLKNKKISNELKLSLIV